MALNMTPSETLHSHDALSAALDLAPLTEQAEEVAVALPNITDAMTAPAGEGMATLLYSGTLQPRRF